jgi:hypothetical protein
MHCFSTMNPIIEVFKTNVGDRQEAERMVRILQTVFPGARINFDLHDCDKILRLEGDTFTVEKVIAVVEHYGFDCAVLE